MPTRVTVLLVCVLRCLCDAQETQEATTARSMPKTTLNESMIISAVVAATMFSVLMVLLPTMIYYRFCAKEDTVDEWPAKPH